MLARFKEYVNAAQFNALRLSLASTQRIRSLSYGEVKKIETINYRTLKPEKDGLFCARIFGPVKDWECNCGKYKRMKHRGVTCEKCGVEVIQARVRRERMGHIELVSPVAHIWYLKGIPSFLSIVLDLSVRDLERVIYFDAYIVINQGKSPYAFKTILSSADYDSYLAAHPEDTDFIADMGAQAIRDVLKKIDNETELKMLRGEYEKTTSVALRHKIIRRLKAFSDLHGAGLTPDLMVLEVLPVLPPDLRPLVPLEGGRFASSDLNELYRRVLNRNIRLRRLIDIEAPSVIIKNEKRMLQEAVDALIDNGRRGQPVRGSNKRPLKSLSEMLRGKQGRFRQNLLGKRVDYSGRSVIVVDPELRLDQCGLPKIMALELFKPYVLAELVRCENAPNLKAAKRLVEEGVDVVWDTLEEVVKDRPVLLNRAPTLHRLGIQAFYPILVEGKAITIHPLVCAAFNADFDGDQMAAHVPLSIKAQAEARELIISTKNLLSPANGRPLTVPSQDMVLGIYYMTKMRRGSLGEGIVFANTDEVITAFQKDKVALHSNIKLRLVDTIITTTVGRVLLYTALPEGAKFEWVNRVLKKSDVARLIERIYYRFGSESTVAMLDKVKRFGFYYSTIGGASFGIDDLLVPTKKPELLQKAEKDVQKIERLYRDGAITNGERYNKVVSIWDQVTTDVANEMRREMDHQDELCSLNADKKFKPFNSVFMMLDSGAKGTKEQVKQLVGMRGLMGKPSGEIMETPICSNFKEGLSVFEYFISTHGARKGQADTALKTANSGYLTRRLVDAGQDVVVTMHDCKTLGYIEIEDLKESGDIICPVSRRAYGRVLAEDLKDTITGALIAEHGTLVDKALEARIADAAVSTIKVRSAMMCQARRGVCAQCYGMDLSRGKLVDIGMAVGVIAAQSIGEPGTQLTMKTFHVGGAISGVVEQGRFYAKHDGVIQMRDLKTVKNRHGNEIVMSRKTKLLLLSQDGRELQDYNVPYGATIFVHEGSAVKKTDKLFEYDPDNKLILTERSGIVRYVDLVDTVTMQERFDEATNTTHRVIIESKGDRYQPAISIVDDNDEQIAFYYLPPGAILVVDPEQRVSVGDILVKIQQAAAKTKDITGGLPRIAELFEARVSKEPAIISDIDGEVAIGGLHRGLIKVMVTSGKTKFEYLVPRSQQLNVSHGEFISAGDPLTAGEPVLHDILRILGPVELQRYLVNQVQIIYRLHGIDIDDRHIEIIVHQMMRKVRIIDAGDSDFLVGDKVDKIHFKLVNQALKDEGKKAAIAKPVLMGITVASLDTESFISAASFQETTRILAEAAVKGAVDHLYGLKENVSIGKLIPGGTGIRSFREHYIGEDISEAEKVAQAQEQKELEKEMGTGA
jgi:DNA-directed RNA polymerase subunit beta'